MPTMEFVDAVREQVDAKVLLSGPSGSGKTKSALELATGMLRKVGGRGIAFIGTEGDRDKLYAKQLSPHGDYRYEYKLLQLSAPFETKKFIAAIDVAVQAGFKVIIIDSLSAEWKWLNDVHDNMPGNSFTNWSKLKPLHRSLIDKILMAQAHIICCARGKDEWLMEDKNGRSVPKKVGVGSQTDKDISYEMMLSLQIEQDTHLAHSDKDNTELWPETRYAMITAKDGEALCEWCQNGQPPAPKPPVIQDPVSVPDIVDDSKSELDTLKDQIVSMCARLGGTKNKELMDILKQYAPPRGNPKIIKDIDKAKELFEMLNKMEGDNV